MSEYAEASTQYGDLQGTLSIDGFEGAHSFLDKLARYAKMPGSYVPIGFSVYAERAEHERNHFWTVDVIAIDATVSGMGGDKISQYVSSVDEVPAVKFTAKIPFEKLLTLFKRFSIVGIWSLIEDKPVRVDERRSGESDDEDDEDWDEDEDDE